VPNKIRVLPSSQTTNSKPVAPPDIWEQLEAIREEMRSDSLKPEGAGWFTASEYAEHKGGSVGYAVDLLRNLHKAGKLERFQASNRKVFYRIKANGRNGQRG